MKKHVRRISFGPALALACASLWLIAGGGPAMLAHSGAVLQAPLMSAPFTFPTIDGTIEPAWGPERTGAGPACTFARLYTLRSDTTLYIAVDVPELTDEAGDTLLLFFDPNHGGGSAPAADDRALRLASFPMGGNTPATVSLYPGTGTAWGAAGAFTQVKHSRSGSGANARLSVEVAMSFTTAPVGFALFYRSATAQDCNGDGDFAESAFQWPATLAVTPGADDQAGIKVPNEWGDLGTADLSGTFSVTTIPSATFAAWGATPGARSLTGDYDGDGKTDVALTGPAGWGSVPVAFSNGDGTFRITNRGVVDVGAWASSAGVLTLTGDFNGDGKTDIALTGVAGWGSVPVAFSNGDGTFIVTNHAVANVPAWAVTANVKVLAADFNADGKTDIGMIGPNGWGSLPVAFSNGDGTFVVTNLPIANFAAWAATPNAKVLTGDFNGDRKADVALTGATGWTTLPVAFSNGNGSFNVTNQPVGDFAGWSATANAQALVGDFNGDGKSDVALTGASGWTTLPVAFSNAAGGFNITNQPVGDFASWAANSRRPFFEAISATGAFIKAPVAVAARSATLGSGAVALQPPFGAIIDPVIRPTISIAPKRLTGDFNGDGRADIALTGISGWSTVPVAFSNPSAGTFKVTNQPIVDFASLAVSANALPGDFNGDHKADIALTGRAGSTALPVAFSASPTP